MKKIYSGKFARLVNGATATLFAVGVAVPALLAGAPASAAQVDNRSVTLSDSSPSGGSITSGLGSGTNVTYQFQFDTSATAQSLVIDFCSNTPLIGDSCTAPAAFDASGATVSDSTGGTTGIGGWTVTTPTANHIELDGASTVSAGTQTFDLKGVTNPSANGSFYARITTYADGTASSYTAASPESAVGSYVDYGGLAMSTTNAVSVTARVMETLQFCVSGPTSASDTSNPLSAACAGATTPAITLGHGTNKVLDGTAVDTAPVYSQLSTNALNGAVVNARLNNSCGGLSSDGGTTCDIPSVGNSPTLIDKGNTTGASAAFGMLVTAGTSDFGAMVPDTAYNGSTHTTCDATGWYTLDTTATGVTGTFGDTVANTGGSPTNNADAEYCFAATATPVTPAGIYKGVVSLIATGTF